MEYKWFTSNGTIGEAEEMKALFRNQKQNENGINSLETAEKEFKEIKGRW
jgi:hypothetical protein